ncbi:universal stress protein [Xanthomarina sp.]|uniref:universal stress protein n=1 Tax=Xanthomarina sp. TaxID=1931211 RepID=UPI002BED460A|nr:universal stress protein [Xanthomarina sp.]HLV40283.1 universal stress protein [Xanthomarina sp.]
MTRKKNLKTDLRIMVAMDLSEMDAILLNYVSFLSKVWGMEHIYFIHNIKQYKLDSLQDSFLEEGISIENIIDKELQRSIEKNYSGTIPHTVLLTTDDYTESILTHLSKEYKIDILLTGNKNELQGTGALNQKLVRMMDANVLLVPEKTRHQLKKVLIPTDFSSDSAQSFIETQTLIASSQGEIEALHVYNIPSFFFPYINTEKAIDRTKKNLKEKVQQFKKRYKLPEEIPFKSIDRKDLSVVEAIELHAEKEDFDIIVVSARGTSKIASLFIGSVTNDLLIRNRNMPLLVIN